MSRYEQIPGLGYVSFERRAVKQKSPLSIHKKGKKANVEKAAANVQLSESPLIQLEQNQFLIAKSKHSIGTIKIFKERGVK
jgi:hypothetical protein